MDRDSFVRVSPRDAAAKERASLRVVMQYWRGDVRVCEIECAGQTLDIHISRPASGDWIAEAHSDHSDQAVVIVGSGSSRSAALLDLAAGWSEKAPALGLHTFDWKAVADVLRRVNASD
jgi:hypothetical protein